MNVLLVGVGYWGKNYLRILSDLDCVDSIYCSDVNIEQEEADQLLKKYPKIKRIYGYPHGWNRDGEMPLIDCAIIATPASTHYKIAKELLQAGKHVLAEKPLCMTSKEAESLKEASHKNQKILMTGNTYLYNSAIKHIKTMLNEGQLGDVFYTDSIRVHLGLVREDVNAIWDLLPHDISILLYLLESDVKKVQVEQSAGFAPGDKTDAAFVSLKFESGVIARMCANWADCEKERVLKIVGSKAKVVFNDLNLQWPLRITEKKELIVDELFSDCPSQAEHLSRTVIGNTVLPRIKFSESLMQQTKNFLSRADSANYEWNNLDEIGVKTVEILERISNSY